MEEYGNFWCSDEIDAGGGRETGNLFGVALVANVLTTVEPLYNGHFRTRYFWPLFATLSIFPLSEVKNVLVTPVGTKFLHLLRI